MPCDRSGGSRRPHPTRSALLTAALGVALAAAAGHSSPARAEGDRPEVRGLQAPAATAGASAAIPAATPLRAAAPEDAGPGASSPRPHRQLSPMAAELAQAIEAERKALSELQARFDRAADEREALAVQREIEQLKTSTEIALLRIQAKHARLKGREAVARRIDAAIEEILHPPVVRDPVTRPAPAGESGGR